MVTFENGVWVANFSFDNKHIPKSAGFWCQEECLKAHSSQKQRKFPYGLTKLYRSILKEVFDGEATDKQLSETVNLMLDIADDEFATHCRRITEDDALEWIAKAVKIARTP